MTIDNGNATVNSEQVVEATAKANPATEKTVPYGRFQEVVEQRKEAEAALETIIDQMVEELPEAIRDLLPDLPLAEKAAWLKKVRAKGVLLTQPLASSPDAKRPAAKPIQDLSAMTPLQMLQAGYGRK